MKVEIIKTASLGNRGYLIYDGLQAIAIDVQRDYERWQYTTDGANPSIPAMTCTKGDLNAFWDK